MELAECVVGLYADIVMDGSKESVNYVYCAMHYNKFATVETSSKIQKLQRKLTSFLFSAVVYFCVVCAHKNWQNFYKNQKKKIQIFKMFVTAGNMSKELKYEFT